MPATVTQHAPLANLPATAAARLGCSRSMIYKLAARGELEMKKIGARTVIPETSLLRYLGSLPDAAIRPEVTR